jgi:Protein of unknown function (DUF3617)
MRNFVLAGVALLALAGCNKGADADGDGKVSVTEAAKEMGSGGAMAMKPGEWEVKVSFDSIDAPGLPPAMATMLKDKMGQGVAVKTCLTKDQAEKPGADFFGGAAENNCTFSEMDRSGNTMKVAMTCKQGAMTISNKMEGSFGADSYTMNMDQKTEGLPTGAMAMKGKVEGKRIGDCPA